MEKQVIFRPRQELQTKDWNSLQSHGASALEHLIYDGIAPGRFYTGFNTTKTSATVVSVAAGRMYDAGKVYAREDATSKDFFNDVPLSQLKKVLLTVSKSTVDADVEPRAFLVDPETRELETESVAMTSVRLATVNATVGSEAALPTVPATPIDQVAIAVVTLDTDGVLSIEMLTENRLPQVYANVVALAEIENWRRIYGNEINTLKTALAAIQRQLGGFLTRDEFASFLTEWNLYRKKIDELDMLADRSDFRLSTHDLLLNNSTSDLAYSGYDARVEEGIRFPVDETTSGHLSLFNANDPDVTVSNNWMLPKYTHRARLDVQGYDSEHRIASYSSETHEIVQGTGARYRIRFGATRTSNVSIEGHSNGRAWTPEELAQISGRVFDNLGILGETWTTPNGQWFRERMDSMVAGLDQSLYGAFRQNNFWIDLINEPYTYERVVETNVAGQGCAQTMLVTQPMWLTQVGLFLSRKGASGDITLLVMECPDDETPSMSNTIAKVTVPYADLLVGSGFEGSGLPALVETKIPIPPTFLKPGRRYGIGLITQGDHWVALGPDSKDATVGSFFFAQNARFNRHPTATDKDMRMTIYAARFERPAVYVDLNETTVTGGVEDIDILADQFTPDGTSFRFEANIGGTWYPLTPDEGDLVGANLQTGQAVVKLRAVFMGSLDLMPALGLGASKSRVIMSNSKTAFKWASDVIDVGGGSTTQNMWVRLRLENFDAAHHTCVAKIKPAGASLETADSSYDVVQSDGTVTRTWVFAIAAATQTYQVELTGTTDDAGILFHAADFYAYSAA